MAYIVSGKTASTDTVSTASFSPADWWDSSEQSSGDYVLIVGHNDGGGTALGIDVGWTELHGAAPNNSASRTGVWYKKHTGSAITAPTLTGANAAWAVCAVLIRDADGTTFVDASAVTEQTASTTTPTAPTATTTTAGCLVLRIVGRDGSGASIQAGMVGQGVTAARTLDNITSTTLNGEAQIEYGVKATAGAVGTYVWTSTVSDGGRQMTVCIRNASGGKVPAYPSASGVQVINDMSATPTLTLLSVNHTTINGTTVRDGTTSGGATATTITQISTTDYAAGMYGWVRGIGQVQTATTGLAGIYGSSFDIGSNIDFSTGLFCADIQFPAASTSIDNNGSMLYFRDNSGGWCVVRPYNELRGSVLGMRSFISYLPNETQIDGSGTINWTIIRHIGVAINATGTTGSNTNRLITFRPIMRLPLTGGAITICGGSSGDPFSWRDVAGILASGCSYKLPSIQGQKQQLVALDVQVGDGTLPTFFNGDACAMEYADTTYRGARFRANDRKVSVKLGASDAFRMGASAVGSGLTQGFAIDAASSTSATYDFGGTIFGMAPVFIDGITVNSCTFSGCSEIDAQSATVTNCTITGTTSTDATIAFDANSTMADTTIDVTGTSAAYHLELGTAVTAFTITDCTFTGTPGTDKIHVKRTTGTVTITTSGSGLVAGDITTDGATVTLVAPSDDLTVTSTVANTLLQIFTTGTQTVLASTTGTSLVYTHTSETVDIVAQKAGYLPQRITGVALSGDVTQAFTMVPDYNYDAAHGLTYTTSASWSRTNNQLTVPTWGPSVRGVYSLMIDSFISETALRNTAFNLSMNGPTTLFLTNGAEGATDASITNMTGGGVRYLSGAGATTAEFVGILSQGVVSGSQAEYELGNGTTITDARSTGDVNEIIKMYGDASHGNFDRRTYLEFKVQRNGYRQAEASVQDTYGITTMEPTLYILNLTMNAIDGLTLGDPAPSGLTLTDDSAAPVSWDAGDGAKNYSITVTDTGSNSGSTILRWLNYNLAQDATFQGKDPFRWPEMVLDNGAAYETLRGSLHKSPADVLAGVRVIRPGPTPHPDFTRFQSDDGTYGTPPTVATASISNIISGSRVRIYNETTATEIYNAIHGSTSYTDTYTDGTDYTAGDTVRVQITYQSGTTAKLCYDTTVVAAASGWSVGANQQDDEVYNALAIDGSAVTGFAADYVNDEVNVTVAANFNIADMYAWWVYNLTTSQGIAEFCGGITALDVGNFRINNAMVDIYIDNTTATNLRQLDNRRIFRADEAYPVKSSGGGGIDVVWRNTILIAETGVSGLTAQESAWLSKVDSLNVTGGAVDADIKKVNGYSVTGNGQAGTEWGPA